MNKHIIDSIPCHCSARLCMLFYKPKTNIGYAICDEGDIVYFSKDDEYISFSKRIYRNGWASLVYKQVDYIHTLIANICPICKQNTKPILYNNERRMVLCNCGFLVSTLENRYLFININKYSYKKDLF
jgi:hypothetical protein